VFRIKVGARESPVRGGTDVAQGVNPGMAAPKEFKPRKGDTLHSRRRSVSHYVSPLRGFDSLMGVYHRAYALGYTCIAPTGLFLFLPEF
jgi:hypothetical protein